MAGVSSSAAGVISSGLSSISSGIPSAAGAFSSFMPAIGAGLDAAGGFLGGLFNANQARKNRQFQERMYNKQVEDNIRFWEMQNRFNLPSAMKQRLDDAGLNSLLMYGSGGQSMVAASPVQSAQAPHGAQGSMSSHTNFGQALLQSQLLQAQIRNINADSELKEANASESSSRTIGQNIQNEVNARTKFFQIAIKKADLDYINQNIEWLCTQDHCLENMTAKNMDNLTSAIEFRQKYYDLDSAQIANQMWYNIESIAIGKAHVSNELKQIAVNMYNAHTNRERVNGELKVFNATIREINNRSDLTEAQTAHEYLKAYNTFLRNTSLDNIGVEQLSGAAGLLLLMSGTLSGRISNE